MNRRQLAILKKRYKREGYKMALKESVDFNKYGRTKDEVRKQILTNISCIHRFNLDIEQGIMKLDGEDLENLWNGLNRLIIAACGH